MSLKIKSAKKKISNKTKNKSGKKRIKGGSCAVENSIGQSNCFQVDAWKQYKDPCKYLPLDGPKQLTSIYPQSGGKKSKSLKKIKRKQRGGVDEEKPKDEDPIKIKKDFISLYYGDYKFSEDQILTIDDNFYNSNKEYTLQVPLGSSDLKIEINNIYLLTHNENAFRFIGNDSISRRDLFIDFEKDGEKFKISFRSGTGMEYVSGYKVS